MQIDLHTAMSVLHAAKKQSGNRVGCIGDDLDHLISIARADSVELIVRDKLFGNYAGANALSTVILIYFAKTRRLTSATEAIFCDIGVPSTFSLISAKLIASIETKGNASYITSDLVYGKCDVSNIMIDKFGSSVLDDLADLLAEVREGVKAVVSKSQDINYDEFPKEYIRSIVPSAHIGGIIRNMLPDLAVIRRNAGIFQRVTRYSPEALDAYHEFKSGKYGDDYGEFVVVYAKLLINCAALGGENIGIFCPDRIRLPSGECPCRVGEYLLESALNWIAKVLPVCRQRIEGQKRISAGLTIERADLLRAMEVVRRLREMALESIPSITMPLIRKEFQARLDAVQQNVGGKEAPFVDLKALALSIRGGQ